MRGGTEVGAQVFVFINGLERGGRATVAVLAYKLVDLRILAEFVQRRRKHD